MPEIVVRSFSDPDAFQAAFRGADVEGVVTVPGNFHAELTRVDFQRLWMQRGDESLPRVLNLAATAVERAAIIFATNQGQPETRVSGMALSSGEIIAWNPSAPIHYRSMAACRWGAISLTREDITAFSETILGRQLTTPIFLRRIRPPAPLFSQLLSLHDAAGHLAKTAPEILLKPEVTRAMEQALVETMISCLASAEPVHARSVPGGHVRVMRRLEEAVEANSEGPLYMSELSAVVGVPYRTLHDCCREHLGMSPKRYLWLRRMHLARRALHRADPEKTTVTEIATSFGFWELGRFSVAYRSLFGEAPSAALRRSPNDPKPGEIIVSARYFAKSA